MASLTTAATSAGSPALSEIRFRKEIEQPVQALPISQITDGAAGLARASWSKDNLPASRRGRRPTSHNTGRSCDG